MNVQRRSLSCVAIAMFATPVATGQTSDFDFGPPEVVVLVESIAPSAFAFADFDGDGMLECVVAGRNEEGIVALLDVDASGELILSSQLELPGQTDWVEVGDVTGDGTLDLVFALRNTAGRVVVLRGVGDGTFDPKPLTQTVGRELRSIRLAHMNDDDALDLIAIGHRSEDVIVLLGDDTGYFAQSDRRRLAPWRNGYVYPQSCSVLDMNGDGALDVLTVSIGARSLHITPTDGEGHLTRARAWRAPLINKQVSGCAYVSLADFDGDGVLEALAPQTNWGHQFFVLFELDEAGDIVNNQVVPTSPFGISWVSAAADFDNDGDQDVAIGHALPGVVAFIENVTDTPGEARFLPPEVVFVGEFIRQLVAVDLEGDGDIDLVAADYTGDALLVFRNGKNDAGGLAGEPPCSPESLRDLSGPALAALLEAMTAEEVRILGSEQ